MGSISPLYAAVRSPAAALYPPGSFPENNPNGCLIKAGAFANLIQKESSVGKMNGIRKIDKANEGWRRHRYLDRIIKLKPSPPEQRRFISSNGLLDDSIELPGADAQCILPVYFFHKIEYF